MPAHQTAAAWWHQSGEGTIVPEVADGFVRVLQRESVGDADPGSSVAYVDTGQAEAHLALLLLELAKSAPRLAPESYPEYVRDRAEWISRRVESVSGQSRFGHVLEQTFREILHALLWRLTSSPSGFGLDVATGFLPLAPLGDAVVPVPGHERSYIVALNPQVFNFANLLGKAWAQMLPIESDGNAGHLDLERPNWLSSVTVDTAGVQRYLDVMFATERGMPSDAAQYWPRGNWVGSAVCIRDAMEHFLVGRGLAHIVLGHTRCAPTRVTPIRGLPLRVFEFSSEQERAADAQAVQWVLESDQFSGGAVVAGWSVVLLLRCLVWLAELTQRRAGEGDGATQGTVSAVQDRFERLTKLLRAMAEMGPSGHGAVRLDLRLGGLYDVTSANLMNCCSRGSQ